MDTLPSASLFLCGRWWLITDCGFSSLFHSCLIMRGACWGPNYSYAICFPLSAEQYGNVNWSVYLFIAFQDDICRHRTDRPAVTYSLNFKRGRLQTDSLFSHQCCLSGPWGCPVLDETVLSPHFLKWLSYGFKYDYRKWEVYTDFHSPAGDRGRTSLCFIIRHSNKTQLSHVFPSYCFPGSGLHCKSWLHDIVCTVQYLACWCCVPMEQRGYGVVINT